jgi:FKBP-type peptidyl-prolyl cis-trans isomerase
MFKNSIHSFFQKLQALSFCVGFVFIFSVPNNLNARTPISSDSTEIEKYLATRNIQAQSTKEGIYISRQQAVKMATSKPKSGDYVQLKYTAKLLTSGTVFDQTPSDAPFVFQVGYRQVIPGLDFAVLQMQVGEKAHVFIPPNLAYGDSGFGNNIPPNAALLFELELQNILTPDDYDQYMRGVEEKERLEFEKKMVQQFETDKKLINEFALSKKWKVLRTPKGLSYMVTKTGKGSMPKTSSQMSVSYEGQLLDGTIFDSNKGKPPFTFTFGEGKVIAGWEEGLAFFNKGSEGYLLIPSKLAYGATPLDDGKTVVPAHAVLIFKVVVNDLK